MNKTPHNKIFPHPLALGPEGESQFARFRAALEYGRGFELFLCGFETRGLLAEVKRRLSVSPPPENFFEELALDSPDILLTLAERLAAIHPASSGRKIVFAHATGWEEDLKGEWAKALRRLNERRNITMHECPNAVILAGPSWLPLLAHDVAPDLWSVRTAIYTFFCPSPSRRNTTPEIEPWPVGMPMSHDLQPPRYYEELASALEGSRRPGDQETRGRLLLKASAAWRLRGDYDSAIRSASMAGDAYATTGEEEMIAASKGDIAGILEQRGDTEEALRIRREEELPIYEKLGDEHSRATTLSSIAGILHVRGETNEALRILREEVLPVFEKLNDVSYHGMTLGQIADILQENHETDEALRIYYKEVLPVFKKLGDTYSHAIAMGRIADILQQRGDTDEALRIYYKEVLPALKKLGDIHSHAIAMDRIADILQQRGDTEEALRIYREEELPVYEKLGNVRSQAITLGNIADILQQRGETEEALRILTDECLPIAQRLQVPDLDVFLQRIKKKILQKATVSHH